MSKLPVPLGHLVMVRVPLKDEMSKGGICLTPLHKDLKREENGEQIGFVESIGPEAYKTLGDGTPWVSVGDKVYFKRYAGIEFRDKEDKMAELYRLMNDDDIYAKFLEEDK